MHQVVDMTDITVPSPPTGTAEATGLAAHAMLCGSLSEFVYASSTPLEKCKACNGDRDLGELYEYCAVCDASICHHCAFELVVPGIKLCGVCSKAIAEGTCPTCKHSYMQHFNDKKAVYSDAVLCQHSIPMFTSVESCNCHVARDIAQALGAVLS